MDTMMNFNVPICLRTTSTIAIRSLMKNPLYSLGHRRVPEFVTIVREDDIAQNGLAGPLAFRN
jgi:hypothetical protein